MEAAIILDIPAFVRTKLADVFVSIATSKPPCTVAVCATMSLLIDVTMSPALALVSAGEKTY